VIDLLVIDDKELPREALELLATLKKQLSSSIALQDVQRREAHIKMTDHWFAHPTGRDEIPIGLRDPDGQILCAHINWRWRLWAAPDAKFPPGAAALVEIAARKLAPFLPLEELPDDVPAPTGGAAGGTSGPAELGIPVAWARKTRN
jgi:hypothetical protein